MKIDITKTKQPLLASDSSFGEYTAALTFSVLHKNDKRPELNDREAEAERAQLGIYIVSLLLEAISIVDADMAKYSLSFKDSEKSICRVGGFIIRESREEQSITVRVTEDWRHLMKLCATKQHNDHLDVLFDAMRDGTYYLSDVPVKPKVYVSSDRVDAEHFARRQSTKRCTISCPTTARVIKPHEYIYSQRRTQFASVMMMRSSILARKEQLETEQSIWARRHQAAAESQIPFSFFVEFCAAAQMLRKEKKLTALSQLESQLEKCDYDYDRAVKGIDTGVAFAGLFGASRTKRTFKSIATVSREYVQAQRCKHEVSATA